MAKYKINKLIFPLVLISLIFTLIDYMLHDAIDFLAVTYYSIPSQFVYLGYSPLVWYAIGKFLGTILLGLIGLYIIPKFKVGRRYKALFLTLLIVLPLQLRYLYGGYYTPNWHIAVLLLHFFILYPTINYFIKRRKI